MSGRKRERSEHTSHKVIEKRRRDRINSCLAELSQAVPSIFGKQTSGKLEKAEILEMTVKYLRVLQRCGVAGRFETGSELKHRDGKYDRSMPNQYNAGYSECLKEIIRYLTEVEGLSPSDDKYQKIVHFLRSRQDSPQHSSFQDYYRNFTCSSNPPQPHLLPGLRVAQSHSMVALPCYLDFKYSSPNLNDVSPQKPHYKPPIEIRAPPELIVSDGPSLPQEPSPIFTEDMLSPLRATPTLWRPFPVNAHALSNVQRQLFQPRPLCLFGSKLKVENFTPESL
ncbi:hairy/enhancer-of-split related with YRPW motif protein 1-like [Anneissia japonica]|uniref:hairy/enhancer-of-split related with YRPW motif protein 1-like n=1 Tax=Anneissia japonica TaxID=1529436 RepID=UPI0014258D10|nr:hairy/enhancer-of-split related with YRPW motif protein 1-like [Anneissia japonica]